MKYDEFKAAGYYPKSTDWGLWPNQAYDFDLLSKPAVQDFLTSIQLPFQLNNGTVIPDPTFLSYLLPKVGWGGVTTIPADIKPKDYASTLALLKTSNYIPPVHKTDPLLGIVAAVGAIILPASAIVSGPLLASQASEVAAFNKKIQASQMIDPNAISQVSISQASIFKVKEDAALSAQFGTATATSPFKVAGIGLGIAGLGFGLLKLLRVL